MNNNNSLKLDSNLTAKEKFAIDSMVKKVHEDWDKFTKEAQKGLENEYNRIGDQAKTRSDAGFIQQQIDKIELLKSSVEEERRIRNIRLEDLRKVEAMLGSKN